jgi:proline dehydrogenase
LASRFVAGETTDEAMPTVRELNTSTLSASLDLLGESVLHAEEAQRACRTYLDLLERIHGAHANANVSVKLTQMGLDIDAALCVSNMRAIIGKAKEYDSFVRIDMEQSSYTARTLQLFIDVLYPEFGNAVGVVLQSYLRRTAADVDAMIALRARVRLCKGAYKEPEDVAFPKKRDVDANYITCMERLLERGNYPGIATHDVKIIEHAKVFAKQKGISAERFEFQMLYGVRRDLQYRLRREGYNMRVYVPFGTHWYPYLMRRLAERPANIAFITANILKEWTTRR